MHESFLPQSRLKMNKLKGVFNYIVLATQFDSVGGLRKCVFAVDYSILTRLIF